MEKKENRNRRKSDKNQSKETNKKELKEKEDSTKYGEAVPSMFAWTGLEEQKEKAKQLENATKKNNK